jgi:exopolyphosphatase / guanosine-5'-triphosphate,3'-diphosphate pyrophosphatase
VSPAAAARRARSGTADAGDLAAVDCGTNSTRLLVVDDTRQLVRLMRITRLGQGVDAKGVLDPVAVARTVAVLDEFGEVLDDLGVQRVRMAATSAVRDASNGREFLDAATRAIGVRAELLSGEEEGRLAYAGATSGLPPSDEVRIVVDIGGGSTELIAGIAGGPPGADAGVATSAPGVVSLDLGCVRLTERFFRHDPPLAHEQAACTEFVARELERAALSVPLLEARILPPDRRVERRLIGLAGTVSTLSMLNQAIDDYDWDRVHHSVLEMAAVERWCTVLASEPSSARARRPGMVEGREDVIVAGAIVLREVMRRFGFSRCLVSETDILDGLVASLRTAPDSGRRKRP